MNAQLFNESLVSEVDRMPADMATQLQPAPLPLAPVRIKAVELDFDGGCLSSDAGIVVLKDIDDQAVLSDRRDVRRRLATDWGGITPVGCNVHPMDDTPSVMKTSPPPTPFAQQSLVALYGLSQRPPRHGEHGAYRQARLMLSQEPWTLSLGWNDRERLCLDGYVPGVELPPPRYH